jgi:cellobiose dehydrogenase (acceptor)
MCAGYLLTAALAAVFAQSSTAVVYTDPKTGIKFDTWSVPDRNTGFSGTYGGMTIGMALPSNALSTDATEYIGILTCSSNSTINTGWCGISHGGGMTGSLLLMAWPNSNQILTSFLFATGYDTPVQYTGDAKLTQISSTINATHYSLIYRCQNCLAWNQNGQTGKMTTSAGRVLLGWAQAFPPPINPTCPKQVSMLQHDNGQSLFPADLDSNAAAPSYSSWAALATKTVTGNCGGTSVTSTATGTATGTATSSVISSTAGPTVTGVPVPTAAYDYIIVGAGAGGIPIADKLSEAGKSVLLIEKGPPSSGRWGGNLKPNWNTPPWLAGTNLTRFDVPGLCNEIWVDSAGIACRDTDQMAGCVLGGGTAVNAGLWWKPKALDWDYNFPTGWKAADMANAVKRVFSRIPGTYFPSSDGQIYLPQGYNVLSNGLKQGGWKEVQALSDPEAKNRTFTHTPYMFSNGERGGPMATYLVSANSRSNFKLWTNTQVKRVIRTGGHITGVEVEPYLPGGYQGVVNVTSISGRVILSAGTFGSARILMRSGIGPQDQLQVVNASRDGPTMINSKNWINLPVGYNLEDHTNTDTVVTHPDVVFYDFYEAFDTPNTTDKNLYLGKRAGILTQAAPNIGPV